MRAGFIAAAACALTLMSACTKEDTKTPNESTARDAAPGPLSETTPPSTSEEETTPPK